MRIDIITIFPDMFDSFFNESIIKRACNKGLLELHTHNLRDFAGGKRKNVDDTAFGGGAGMVLKAEPIAKCIDTLKNERTYEEVIYMAPDGDLLDQKTVNTLSMNKNIIILCGRYKGVDQRIRDHYITKEVSIGEYVLSGGEIPAAVLTDCLARVIPGVLSDESSALLDSYQDKLLDAPVYTKPADFKGWKVPDVLLSGNDRKINEWRYEQSLIKTRERRPGMEGE